MDGEDESRADLVVRRRRGCICVEAESPFTGDVQALLKEWDYKKYRVFSTALAELWGCLLVVCPDYETEAEALEAGVDEPEE